MGLKPRSKSYRPLSPSGRRTIKKSLILAPFRSGPDCHAGMDRQQASDSWPGRVLQFSVVPSSIALRPNAGRRWYYWASVGIEFSCAPGLLDSLELNQALVVSGSLRECGIQALGGEFQKRGDGRRSCGGNELEALQKLAQPVAIGVAAVGDKMELGQALTVATAPAANGLDELIRAGRRRQDHGNPGCLRKALIQFGPTCSLLVWKENYLGLTRCVDRLVTPAPNFE
jgi:hypothetical protein